MRIAGMNITFRHFPIEYFFNSMESLGIKHIELWAGEPHLYVYRSILKNIRILRKEIKSRNLNVVCFTPEQCVYPYNIASSDDHLRKTSIDYFIENMYAALELGTNKMLITSGSGDYSVPIEHSWSLATDSIYQLTKIAEKEGIVLCLEPLTKYESNLITDLKGLTKMVGEINSPSLKGMIDTVAMQLADETPDNYFAQLGELSHFHLIDGDSQSDAHLSLDDGVINWREYLNSLKNNGYNDYCTLEIMGSKYYQDPSNALFNSMKKLNEMGIY